MLYSDQLTPPDDMRKPLLRFDPNQLDGHPIASGDVTGDEWIELQASDFNVSQ